MHFVSLYTRSTERGKERHGQRYHHSFHRVSDDFPVPGYLYPAENEPRYRKAGRIHLVLRADRDARGLSGAQQHLEPEGI